MGIKGKKKKTPQLQIQDITSELGFNCLPVIKLLKQRRIFYSNPKGFLGSRLEPL